VSRRFLVQGAVLQRKIRRLRWYAGSPADVCLTARMLGWALVLPVLKFAVPLPRLVRFVWAGPRGTTPRCSEREARIVALAQRVYRPGLRPDQGRCLQRSLLLYRFLSENSAAPRLVIGVSRTAGRVEGHAWVLVDDAPVGEPPNIARAFVPVAVFGRAGALLAAASSAAPSAVPATAAKARP
jgi:hypothetical protein